MLRSYFRRSTCRDIDVLILLVLSLLVSQQAHGQGTEDNRITLTPIHANQEDEVAFRMIIQPNLDQSQQVFDVSVFATDTGENDVSRIDFEYTCSLGISVCGMGLANSQTLSFPARFLSSSFLDLQTGKIDFCEIEYLFTFSAYRELLLFDWGVENDNIRYFSSPQVPPNFIGIEEWSVSEKICNGEKYE